MAIRTFYKGSTTFLCRTCERRTRDTGAQSVGIGLCPQCYELAGIENEINDGVCPFRERKQEITRLLGEIVTKGGSVAEWRTVFDLVFDTKESPCK